MLFAAILLAACSAATVATPTPGPTIIPGPSGATTLDAGELRLLLIERLGPRWYCDPDEYPIAHGTEQERAIERFPEMQAEGVLYRAAAKRLGIDTTGSLTDAQKLAIYQLWKVALSVPLDPVGNGRYRFDYTAQPVAGATQGTRTAGLMAKSGAITVEQQAPADEPNCPICLARGSRIDVPGGSIAVDELRLGDRVWTLDRQGHRIAGTVIALGSTEAPADHHVIRLTLADGRTVTASPGHPLADGRLIGELRVGDQVDGSTVVGLASIRYAGGETFDLVASGATGAYLVDGVPLGTRSCRGADASGGLPVATSVVGPPRQLSTKCVSPGQVIEPDRPPSRTVAVHAPKIGVQPDASSGGCSPGGGAMFTRRFGESLRTSWIDGSTASPE